MGCTPSFTWVHFSLQLSLTLLKLRALTLNTTRIGAILLAGGKSSRMGSEKGLVDFGGKPMVAPILEALQCFTSSILMVANHPAYGQFGHGVIGDEYREKGPLAGIVTGLRHSTLDLNFVLGCDTPLVPPRLLHWMLDSYQDEAVVALTFEGRIQPLVGLYHRKALPTMERLLHKGQLKLRIALEELQAAVLDPQRHFPGFDPNWLRNFNTRQEIDAYLQGR